MDCSGTRYLPKNVQTHRSCTGLSKVSGFCKWDVIRRCRTDSRIVHLQDLARTPLCSRPSFIISPLQPLSYLSVRTEYYELNREFNTPYWTEVWCDWICERKDALYLHQTINQLHLRRPEVSVVIFCIYGNTWNFVCGKASFFSHLNSIKCPLFFRARCYFSPLPFILITT